MLVRVKARSVQHANIIVTATTTRDDLSYYYVTIRPPYAEAQTCRFVGFRKVVFFLYSDTGASG